MQRLLALLRFDGRLGRLSYWRAYLTLAIALAIVWCGGLLAIMSVGRIGGVALVLLAPVFIGVVGIAVRRLHDRGKSGWWVLPFVIFPTLMSFSVSARVSASGWPWLDLILSLASVVLSIWGLVEIGFRRGVAGPNRYGEDPYAAI